METDDAHKLARIMEANAAVLDREREIGNRKLEAERAKTALKAAEEEYNDAVAFLRREIDDQNGDQLQLFDRPMPDRDERNAGKPFLGDEKPQEFNPGDGPGRSDFKITPKAIDVHGLAHVRELGLEKNITDKLLANDPPLLTVADVTAAMASGSLLEIPGIGEKAIDKISNAMIAFRKKPAPSEPAPEDPAPAESGPEAFTGLLEGETSDPNAEFEGQVAHQAGRSIDSNHYEDRTSIQWRSFNHGWTEQAREDRELEEAQDRADARQGNPPADKDDGGPF